MKIHKNLFVYRYVPKYTADFLQIPILYMMTPLVMSCLWHILRKYIKYTLRVDKLFRILNDSELVGCQKKFQDERVTYILHT